MLSVAVHPCSHKFRLKMRNTLAWKYYVRESKASKIDGLAPVELSISVNSKRVFVNLPFRCKPSDFAKKRGRPKEIEEYLNAQTSTINKVLAEMAENDIPVTAERLRDYFRTGGVKSYTIQDMADEFLSIHRERVGNGICMPVYRRYEMVITLFKDEIDFSQEVTAITNAVVRKFFASLDRRYVNSTAVGMKTKFKSFITFGINNDRIKVNPLQGIRVSRETKPIDFLTEEQIRTIIDTEMPNESLERVRDVFVFQMASGLSYSDIASFRSEDLQEENGVYFIQKNRVKTNTPYTAYVYKEGVDVYNKYGGNLPIISNQKINAYLKVIGDIVGIPHLHSHLARHSYCTRLLRANVPIKVISKAAGHVNSNITEKFYAHLEDRTVINTIAAAVR